MRFFICFLVCSMQILFLCTRAGITTYTYSYLQTTAEIESYDGFTFTGASGSSLYYDCSGVTYLGGYNNIGQGCTIQRAFSDLPFHNQIQVSFDFIFGNSWYSRDMGYLYADGNLIWSDFGESTESNYNASLACGFATLASYPNNYFICEYTPSPAVKFSHTASTLTLIWNGTLSTSENYEWFGLRNFVMVVTGDCTLANCAACQSVAVCSTCNSGYYLYNGLCTISCPTINYYPNSTNNTCEAYDSTCYTCTSPGASSCTSCTGSSYLYQGTCGSTCPTGYYPNSTNNICEVCDPTCYTCTTSGASSCTSCTGSSYLYQGTCGSTCPTGYYPDSTNKICEACDPTCYTCTTSGASSCTSCTGTSYLYQDTCGSTCPTGYYPDSTNKICEACDPTCYTCTTSGASSCTSCTGTSYLYQDTCGSTCPTGYYPDSTNKICEACDPTCYTCTTSGASSCTSCTGTSYLHQGTYGSTWPNSTGNYCLQACPLGYTPNHTSNRCVTSLVKISQAQSGTLVAAPVVTSAALIFSSVVAGSFSISMVMCLVATESLANMQYLNINHSNIASTIYAGISSSPMPNWIAHFNTLQRDTLIFNWGIFKYNQISSLYLDNYGDKLVEMMIYIGIYLLALFFALFLKTEQLTNSFTGKAYLAAFSFFISKIIGNMQAQILFSILQIIRLDLFLDTYSKLSLITGYLTISISIGLIGFSFFRVKNIFNSKNRLKSSPVEVSNSNEGNTSNQYNWLEKKYELMFGDFKNRSTHQFFFAYWIVAFDVAYILLIFSFQAVPVIQCLSVVVLVLAFIIFSGIIQPFRKRRSAFSHFFNFSCVLVVGIMNLILSIIDALNNDFSGVEIQGWFVVSVIILNSGTNLLFSLGGIIFEIYQKLNKKVKELNRTPAAGRPTIDAVSHCVFPRIRPSSRELNGPTTNDSVLRNLVDAHSDKSIAQSTARLRRIHCEEGDSQSIPRANEQSLIRADLEVDSSRSEIFRKKTHERRSHQRGLVSNITNEQVVDKNMMVFDINFVYSPSREVLRKRGRSKTDKNQ